MAYMENNTSLAGLLEPFRFDEVEGVEIAIRREGGEFKLVVACRSSRGRMFEHEGECSNGDCDGALQRLLNEAVSIATATLRTGARQNAALSHASAPPVTPSEVKKLSEREREVLRLVAEGDSNKKIAVKLGISVHTVNAHRVSIMSKLDVHDARGLTRFAAQHGMIDVHQRR